MASAAEWRAASRLPPKTEDVELFHPQLKDRAPDVVMRVWEGRGKENVSEAHRRAMEMLEQWQRGRPQQPSRAELAARYRKFADIWYEDTHLTSSLQAKVLHPAYLRIIGMGTSALPFILRDLRDRPAQWFVALVSITDADPVRPGDTFATATKRWLRWGREHGIEID